MAVVMVVMMVAGVVIEFLNPLLVYDQTAIAEALMVADGVAAYTSATVTAMSVPVAKGVPLGLEGTNFGVYCAPATPSRTGARPRL